MKEIGGYLELDTYNMPMMHGDAMAFNSGRSCLAYLIEKKISKKCVYRNFFVLVLEISVSNMMLR